MTCSLYIGATGIFPGAGLARRICGKRWHIFIIMKITEGVVSEDREFFVADPLPLLRRLKNEGMKAYG
jgi:hypothetical protein